MSNQPIRSFAALDADGGLREWNDDFAAEFAACAEMISAGAEFETIAEAALLIDGVMRRPPGAAQGPADRHFTYHWGQRIIEVRETRSASGGWFRSARDITAERRALEAALEASRNVARLNRRDQKELRAARAAAAGSDKARTELFAVMRHRLRSPMHGILGLNGRLLQTDLTPEQRGTAQLVQDAGEALVSIINDFLKLSEIERGGAGAPEALERLSIPGQEAAADEGAAEKSRPLHILLAEDHVINQRFATAILGQAGHQVDVADNGAQAVKAAEGCDYDLILMDIHMPEMDGLEAAARIRALPGPRGRTPIYAVSADDDRAAEDRYRACGIDGWITKPFMAASLLAAVDAVARGVAVKDAGERRTIRLG